MQRLAHHRPLGRVQVVQPHVSDVLGDVQLVRQLRQRPGPPCRVDQVLEGDQRVRCRDVTVRSSCCANRPGPRSTCSCSC
jgi:hypothetical protein